MFFPDFCTVIMAKFSHTSGSHVQSGDFPSDPTALASTSLQKETDELTNSLDIDTPFPAPEPWPGRS